MLTTQLMNSVIEKLNQLPNKISPLIFNSEQAINKQNQLKKLINSVYIEESSFIVLGAFLQNINLNIFSTDELILLLNFNYNSINAYSTITPIPNNFNKNPLASYYDLDNTIINMEFKDINNINNKFKELHSINKNLSIEYLISYLVTQI